MKIFIKVFILLLILNTLTFLITIKKICLFQIIVNLVKRYNNILYNLLSSNNLLLQIKIQAITTIILIIIPNLLIKLIFEMIQIPKVLFIIFH